MNTQDNILDLYYSKHLKQKDIAVMVGVTSQYVSKVVKADDRYKQEKENRKNNNAKKRKEYLKCYFKTYDRPKNEDNSYHQLQTQLAKDSQELSYSNGYMSDYAFVKWNPNAYHRDKNGNLALNKGLNVGFDVPRVVNMNRKVPTQKYKQRCYCR